MRSPRPPPSATRRPRPSRPVPPAGLAGRGAGARDLPPEPGELVRKKVSSSASLAVAMVKRHRSSYVRRRCCSRSSAGHRGPRGMVRASTTLAGGWPGLLDGRQGARAATASQAWCPGPAPRRCRAVLRPRTAATGADPMPKAPGSPPPARAPSWPGRMLGPVLAGRGDGFAVTVERARVTSASAPPGAVLHVGHGGPAYDRCRPSAGAPGPGRRPLGARPAQVVDRAVARPPGASPAAPSRARWTNALAAPTALEGRRPRGPGWRRWPPRASTRCRGRCRSPPVSPPGPRPRRARRRRRGHRRRARPAPAASRGGPP